MTMTTVSDLMHRGVIFCYPEDTARDVAKIMRQNRIRSVAVVDETGDVVGLISTMEILAQYGRSLGSIQAREIMRPYRFKVDPRWPVERAIDLMKRKKIEHLVIIDSYVGPRIPVGMLTCLDIVRYMSGIQMGSVRQFLRLVDEPPRDL
jgi:CBS domain-containing protein